MPLFPRMQYFVPEKASIEFGIFLEYRNYYDNNYYATEVCNIGDAS